MNGLLLSLRHSVNRLSISHISHNFFFFFKLVVVVVDLALMK